MWHLLKDFFKGTSVARKVILHVLIVGGFLAAVWILTVSLYHIATKTTSQWSSDIQSLNCTSDGKQYLQVTAQSSNDEKARLGGQFEEVKNRMNFHFHLMKDFYENFFVTLILTGVLASIAAITLLFITTDGWNSSSPYARAIFLVATASATYCAAFPNILQQQKNVDDNRKLYLQYVSLTNEMCSYAATGEAGGPIKDNKKDAKAFIHYVDSQLETLGNVAVGFDASKTPDFYDALRTSLNNRAKESEKQESAGTKKTKQKKE